MNPKPMWSEGLFLTPQHLQIADEYHEQLLDQRIRTVGAHLWGLSDLSFDEDELARGTLRLSRCVAVMPDGMLVRIGGPSTLAPLSAMAGGALKGGGRSLEVFLGVPAGNRGAARSAEEAGGARYVQRDRVVADAFGMAEDAEVQCLQPNARLLLGSDDRQGFVTLKLAEITLGESGRLTLSDRYVPPCLQIACSPFVLESLRRVVSALAAKQKSLVGKYGGRSAAMIEFGAADMATFWYLHTANSWLPVLMHHADSGASHPEQLYLALCAFAGQLSSFEAASDPVDLPRFRFDDLHRTFAPLFELILRLLGTVVSSRYRAIPLEQTQPGLFVGKVDDPNLLTRHSLYLLAGGEIPEETLREDVPRYLKVGSIDQIAQIVQSALPGVATRIDLAPPAALPVRSHLVYLRLERDGRYWEAVKQSGSIAIYQPVKPNRVKLELVAIEAQV